MTGTLTTGTLTLTATTGTSEQGQIATWTEGGSGGTADFSSVTPQAYGLVAPVSNISLTGVKVTLGATGALTGGNDHTYSTVSGNSLSVTWEKGKHYIYTMTVTDRGLEFGSVEVADWESSGDPVTVPVE